MESSAFWDDTMPARSRSTHQALLHSGDEELLTAAIPFIQEGLAQGDAVNVLATPAQLAAMRQELGTDARHVQFADVESTAIPLGPLFSALHHLITHLPKTGGGVRVLESRSLTAYSIGWAQEVCRYEAVTNKLLPRSGVQLLCPYDLERLPAQVINGARRSHPELITNGVVMASNGYIDATALFHEQDDARDLPEPTSVMGVLTLPADTFQVQAFLASYAVKRLGPERAADFSLAVHEVVTNATVHADPATMRVWEQDGNLVCEVNDDGPGLSNPLIGYAPPTLAQTGGRGLWLARQLADLVELHTSSQGTTVRLHARIPRP
jgi:anti-sigma regulatory factor (Ser/Thr protein kinase)